MSLTASDIVLMDGFLCSIRNARVWVRVRRCMQQEKRRITIPSGQRASASAVGRLAIAGKTHFSSLSLRALTPQGKEQGGEKPVLFVNSARGKQMSDFTLFRRSGDQVCIATDVGIELGRRRGRDSQSMDEENGRRPVRQSAQIAALHVQVCSTCMHWKYK
jgi:hypothetical protein